MERYDYYKAVKEDCRKYIMEQMISANVADPNEIDVDYLYDECFNSDSITGNASGSYTFSTYKAEENLCHNFDLLLEALREYGYESVATIVEKGAEWCDVLIRCHVVASVCYEAYDELCSEYNEAIEIYQAEAVTAW